jgi:hypothetical protein
MFNIFNVLGGLLGGYEESPDAFRRSDAGPEQIFAIESVMREKRWSAKEPFPKPIGDKIYYEIDERSIWASDLVRLPRL